jgi:hypothetical protein
MNGTRRAIGVAFFLLAVLGTAWALEHRGTGPSANGGAPRDLSTPTTLTPPESGATRVINAQPEYDRSDLLLTQG